jgi:hypothetical protein
LAGDYTKGPRVGNVGNQRPQGALRGTTIWITWSSWECSSCSSSRFFGEKAYMKFNKTVWSKEKPHRINGCRVRIGGFDNLGPNPPEQLMGVISYYSGNQYGIDFEEPFIRDNIRENYAIITARHAGYPISRMSTRGILGVNGVLESGHGFIGLVAKAKQRPGTPLRVGAGSPK